MNTHFVGSQKLSAQPPSLPPLPPSRLVLQLVSAGRRRGARRPSGRRSLAARRAARIETGKARAVLAAPQFPTRPLRSVSPPPLPSFPPPPPPLPELGRQALGAAGPAAPGNLRPHFGTRRRSPRRFRSPCQGPRRPCALACDGPLAASRAAAVFRPASGSRRARFPLRGLRRNARLSSPGISIPPSLESIPFPPRHPFGPF